MNLAPAFAAHGSGRFQSLSAASRASATEIGLALRGYAGAALPLNPSLNEADVLRPVVLGTGWGGVAASPASAGVVVRMAGDLSARGARSRQWGLESSRQPRGESRRNRGTN